MGELRRKIRNALAYRSLDRFDSAPMLPVGRPVFGRIECEVETGEPEVVIDGRAFSWSEFARLLLSCEGWQVRLEVRALTEGWPG